MCVCGGVSVHMPWHKCRGQRTTSAVGPCLPFCSRQGLSVVLHASWCTSFGRYPCFHLPICCRKIQMLATSAWLNSLAMDSNSDPQACWGKCFSYWAISSAFCLIFKPTSSLPAQKHSSCLEGNKRLCILESNIQMTMKQEQRIRLSLVLVRVLLPWPWQLL